MFHLWIKQVISFTGKMFEKHLRKSDILSKDAGFMVGVPTDLFLLCAHDYSTKLHGLLSLFFLQCMTIRPKFRVNIDFFFFFFHLYTTMWPKIMVLIDLIFLFLHSHLIKNEGPHWFVSFICTSPFGQITWSSFICFFFCLRPFDQKLWSTLMYFLHLYTIIWPKIRVLMNLIFLFVHNH